MTKRSHDTEFGFLTEEQSLERESIQKARKQSDESNEENLDNVPCDKENVIDNHESDTDSETSNTSDEDGSSRTENSSNSDDSTPSDDDESALTTETDAAEEHSWVLVHPPEPDKNIKSKFTISDPGPFDVPKSKQPIDFFNLFFTEELFEMMVRNTNAFANYILQNPVNARKLKYWYDVTIEEMKKFWSILINMGLSQRSRYELFWSSNPSQCIPFFARVMDLKRFKTILFMFNLTSENDAPRSLSELDPLVEVHSLLQSFNTSFKRYFVPDQEIRFDESLIYPTKDNDYKIQYLPKKDASRSGIQKFEICDASSGYIVHIGLKRFRPGDKDNEMFSEKLVLDLLNDANLTGKGYHLFLKKTYVGFKLSQELLASNTFLTGPVHNTKYGELPSGITKTRLKPDETMYLRYGDHLLVSYNPFKPVYISTGCHAEEQMTGSGKCQQRVRTLLIRKYFKCMGGKDKSYLHITSTIATNSCWKKIAFNLVDLALYNSFILFKGQRKKNQYFSRVQFLEDIVESLSLQPCPIIDLPVFIDLGKGHKLVRSPRYATGVCSICLKKKGKKIQAMFICPGCDVHVHEKCFKELKHVSDTQSVDQGGPSTGVKTEDPLEIVTVKMECEEGYDGIQYMC